MSKKTSQKFVYIENTTAEENENRIPGNNIILFFKYNKF
jgi:hypothetical protein